MIPELSSKEDFLKYIASIDFDSLPQNARDAISLFLEDEAVKMARESFYHYVLLLGPHRIDGFQTGRHIERVCEELQDLSERMWKKTGLTPRKMLSLPPGGMKSELCSRLFPSWLLGKYPKVRMIIVGHGIDFAKDEFGAKIRDIVRMDEYKKIFPQTELREDKQTAGRFLTTEGGEMVCSSLEAKIAGRRGHIVIVDDALVEEDALSKPIRNATVRRYMPNIRSRLLMTPDCAELQVGTRWTQGDLFDFLEQEDAKSGAPWKIIKIPALLDKETSDWLRKEGDPEDYLAVGTSFWPELHPTRRLEMIRASYANNMSRWNATYQQNPTPEDGVLLSPNDFKHWKDETPPVCHTILITADTAYTKNTQSDFTAYQVWGIFKHNNISGQLKNHAILLNEAKGKWDFPELCSIFVGLYNKYKPDYFVLEERSSGLALIPELRGRGLPIYGWKTEKDKHVRMHAAAPIVKSGIVWVPMPEDRPDIIEKTIDFVGEICMFPGGSHDDRCFHPDTCVMVTRDGIIDTMKIKNVKVGDIVIGSTGQENVVLQTMVNPTEESQVVKVAGRNPIVCTPNHPFLIHPRPSSEQKKRLGVSTEHLVWREAAELSTGDFLVEPIFNHKEPSKDRVFDMLDFVPKECQIEKVNLTGSKVSGVVATESTIKLANPRSSAINRFVPLDEKLAKLLGYYTAEGSCGKHNVSFAFNLSEENSYALEVKTLLKEVFDVDASIVKKGSSNCVEVTKSSKILREFFKTMVPGRAPEKRIPSAVKSSRKEVIRSYLVGLYNGDGSWSDREITLATSSSKMKEDLYQILPLFGAAPVCSTSRSGRKNPLFCVRVHGVNKVAFYSNIFGEDSTCSGRADCWVAEGYVWRPIRELYEGDYSGEVYNLEVTGDHTYLAEGIVVHNCDALSQFLIFARDNGLLMSDGTEGEFIEEDDDFDDYYQGHSYTSSLLR